MTKPKNDRRSLKGPPGPKPPDDAVAKTSAKYLEAYEKLTGKKL